MILPAAFELTQGWLQKTLIALVISPLSALAFDQKAHFISSGITVEFLGELQQDEQDEQDC